MNDNLDLTDKKEPEWIVPFLVKEENVEHIFETFCRETYMPSKVRKVAKDIKFSPCFIPAYVVNATANVKYVGRYKIRTSHHKTSSGNLPDVWHRTQGHSVEKIKSQILLATDKYDYQWFENIGEFDFEDILTFSKETVNTRETYTINKTLAECWDIGKKALSSKIKKTLESKIYDEYNAFETTVDSQEEDYVKAEFNLVLLPIFESSFVYKGKKYSVLINGQTGKVLEQLPKNHFNKIMWFIVILINVLVMYFGFIKKL